MVRDGEIEFYYSQVARLSCCAALVVSFAVWIMDPKGFTHNTGLVQLAGGGIVVVMFGFAVVRVRFLDLSDEEFDQVDVRSLNLRPLIDDPLATLGRFSIRAALAALWNFGVFYLPRHFDAYVAGATLLMALLLSVMFLLRLRGGSRTIRLPRRLKQLSRRRTTAAIAITLAWFSLLAWSSHLGIDWLRLLVLVLGAPLGWLNKSLLAQPTGRTPRVRGHQS